MNKVNRKTVNIDSVTHEKLAKATSILEGRRCERDKEAKAADKLQLCEVAEMAIHAGISLLLESTE